MSGPKRTVGVPENVFAGSQVAGLRRSAQMSQADLAARLSQLLGKNVDATTITRLERGERPITVQEVSVIAKPNST